MGLRIERPPYAIGEAVAHQWSHTGSSVQESRKPDSVRVGHLSDAINPEPHRQQGDSRRATSRFPI